MGNTTRLPPRTDPPDGIPNLATHWDLKETLDCAFQWGLDLIVRPRILHIVRPMYA